MAFKVNLNFMLLLINNEITCDKENQNILMEI